MEALRGFIFPEGLVATEGGGLNFRSIWRSMTDVRLVSYLVEKNTSLLVSDFVCALAYD